MMRAFLIAAALCSALAASARAADCDQFHQYPNQQGDGDAFSGISPMPAVPSGGAVAQWTCFFPRNTPIADVKAVLLRANGAQAPYATYDVTFNRTYYPGQTAVKVSFQLIPGHKLRRGMKVEYRIEFEPAAAAAAVPTTGQPALACSQATNYCVGIYPNGDYWVGNPRTDFQRQGNLYADKPDPKAAPRRFSVSCSEQEFCVAFDDQGARFAGSIRITEGGDNFRKR